jgi:hypothetical protein
MYTWKSIYNRSVVLNWLILNRYQNFSRTSSVVLLKSARYLGRAICEQTDGYEEIVFRVYLKANIFPSRCPDKYLQHNNSTHRLRLVL